MTIKGLLLRFFLSYAGTLITAGFLLNYFGVKFSGINTAVLIACVLWVCMSFGQRNKRYFTTTERIGAVLGMWIIDMALQFLFGAAALSASDRGVESAPLLFVTLIVGFLHLAGIYVTALIAGKQVDKQNSRA